MTTDEQYAPSEKAVRRAYTYYYDPATIRRPDTEQEFDRFLARVRRDAWQAGHTTGFDDALLACEIATGTKPGPPPGPTPNPYCDTETGDRA